MNNGAAKKTMRLAERILRDSDIDVNESFLMEMNSDGELSVKGCRDIKDYTDNNILLLSDDYYIAVEGGRLYLKSYSRKSTVICGNIERISFMKREREKNV